MHTILSQTRITCGEGSIQTLFCKWRSVRRDCELLTRSGVLLYRRDQEAPPRHNQHEPQLAWSKRSSHPGLAHSLAFGDAAVAKFVNIWLQNPPYLTVLFARKIQFSKTTANNSPHNLQWPLNAMHENQLPHQPQRLKLQQPLLGLPP